MTQDEQFAVFWQRFPRRVGKLDAMKAYRKARKVATADDILAGVDRYIATKPEYADWCHPSTWLNKGRWMDEDDRRSGADRRTETRGDDRRGLEWLDECQRIHGGSCGSHYRHDFTMKLAAMKAKAS